MTGQQLADAVGVSKGHISNIENFNADLMPAIAQSAADALRIGIETLWKVPPSEAADAEQGLLAIFRHAGTEQQQKILKTAKKLALG